MEYLVETALLTHGLKSISNTDILDKWTIQKKNIVWVSQGEIKIGDMEKYLFFQNYVPIFRHWLIFRWFWYLQVPRIWWLEEKRFNGSLIMG